jgi:hypothetical protein
MMNRIIDGVEDGRILREVRIILNHLESGVVIGRGNTAGPCPSLYI